MKTKKKGGKGKVQAMFSKFLSFSLFCFLLDTKNKGKVKKKKKKKATTSGITVPVRETLSLQDIQCKGKKGCEDEITPHTRQKGKTK